MSIPELPFLESLSLFGSCDSKISKMEMGPFESVYYLY